MKNPKPQAQHPRHAGLHAKPQTPHAGPQTCGAKGTQRASLRVPGLRLWRMAGYGGCARPACTASYSPCLYSPNHQLTRAGPTTRRAPPPPTTNHSPNHPLTRAGPTTRRTPPAGRARRPQPPCTPHTPRPARRPGAGTARRLPADEAASGGWAASGGGAPEAARCRNDTWPVSRVGRRACWGAQGGAHGAWLQSSADALHHRVTCDPLMSCPRCSAPGPAFHCLPAAICATCYAPEQPKNS